MDSSGESCYVGFPVLSDPEILELRACADAAERAIEESPEGAIRRVVIIAETASTQDTAAVLVGEHDGLLVVAGRQSAGRGRLGRAWTQRGGLGVAATLAIRLTESQRSTLSLAVGVAVVRTIEDTLQRDGPGSPGRVGIRWPNDVIEVAGGRKLAGVLIESRSISGWSDPLMLIGVGINVAQHESDWNADLARRAVSLRQLGSRANRATVLATLVARLNGALAACGDPTSCAELLESWKTRDTLLGTQAVFAVGATTMAGRVESVEPNLEIILRQPDGLLLRLPAATTSLVPQGSF